MTFQYPFALLALLAIPVLIIIYLLKNKYKEATAPSTYLWEISERFLKRRNPLRKMEHLISLIVQIVAIATLAIAVAHPIITLPGMADNIVFVLDTTASMQMETGEKNSDGTPMTRFDKAVSMIDDIASEAALGSKFSLIATDTESRIVCKNVDDLSRFELYLATVSVSESTASYEASLKTAQSYFSEGTSNICYLATDKDFSENTAMDNINILNVCGDETNYAVYNLTYTYSSSTLTLTATTISYTQDADIYIKLYCNDDYLGRTKVSATKGEESSFNVEIADAEGKYKEITSVKAEIDDSTNPDSLAADNTMIVYVNNSVTDSKICVVSDQPLFFKAAFSALKSKYSIDPTYLGTKSYGGKSGYDIYIFDNYTPASLPSDGAVWLFGASDDLPNSGYYVQNTYEASEGVTLEYSENYNDILYTQLTEGLVFRDITVSKYVRYSVFGDFTTILSYNNSPFVFAGRNENNQRQIVFSFDIHDSNLWGLSDWLSMVGNCINYSNPSVLNKYAYVANDTATLSLSDTIQSIDILHPSKKSEPADLSEDYLTLTLDEVGTYQITIIYTNNTYKQINIYVSYPKEEGNPLEKENTKYSLAKNENTVRGDGMFDNILPVVIVAAVLFALDWILYAHEQY